MPKPPKEVVISKAQIGVRIRALRQAREMTQANVAAIMGVPHTTVSGIERGVRGVTLHQLVKLARALDVSAAELLDEPGRKDHRGAGRLPPRLRRMEALPRPKRRVLHELIDAFLEKHSKSA